jgi:undecaprenyl-phosphate 4-deoxy-4-formamido-L-arabinose transferase
MKTTSKLFLKGTGKGSSFRLMKHDLVKNLIGHSHHFAFIDEIILWHTNDIVFVKVDHHKRSKGKSGYSSRRLMRLVYDLIYFYTNIPLKLMVYGGLTVSIITFILGLQFIIKKLMFNTPLGYTSLIVTVLFSTSIIVFSLGVIGGYLSRIYTVQNKKPSYTIKKILD